MYIKRPLNCIVENFAERSFSRLRKYAPNTRRIMAICRFKSEEDYDCFLKICKNNKPKKI